VNERRYFLTAWALRSDGSVERVARTGGTIDAMVNLLRYQAPEKIGRVWIEKDQGQPMALGVAFG
jgi:hypothetical protein